MKLKEYALLAEIIGAVAIVLSLVFVGLELRNNTGATFSSNRQSLSGRFEALALTRAASPVLAEVISKESDDLELTAVELSMYGGYIQTYLRLTEEAFLQYCDGQLSEEYWQVRANSLVQLALSGSHARRVATVAMANNILVKDFSDWLTRGSQ